MYDNEVYSETQNNNQMPGQTPNQTPNQTVGVYSGANNYYDRVYPNTSPVFVGSHNNQGTVPVQEPVPVKKKKEKKQKKGSFFGKALVSLALGLIFGACSALGFWAVWLGSGMAEQAGNQNVVVGESNHPAVFDQNDSMNLTNTNTVTVIESDISEVVEEVMPAMVSIVNNYTTVGTFWGQTYTQEDASSGSGIIVGESDEELLIVSNYHVIADTTTLEVTFIDGITVEAKVKGTDADMDLAVIAVPLSSISAETRDAIAVATLGDSDNLKLGEPVIAIGNALGYGQSVTNGIVSALDRKIGDGAEAEGTFIQTNAEINPGNSGGALLNIRGEVIGINSNKIGGDIVEGMGYAIPISSASPIIADLMERQTRYKVAEDKVGYLGVNLQDVTEDISLMFNMPKGVYVYAMEPGSAAEKCGILPGDVITHFDGEKITSYDSLKEVLQYFAAGDTVKVTIMRRENGEYVKHVLDITLSPRPENR